MRSFRFPLALRFLPALAVLALVAFLVVLAATTSLSMEDRSVLAPASVSSLEMAGEVMPTSPPPSPPPDPHVEAWVENTLAAMDLRQRVAQLVLPWIPGGRIAPGTVEHRRLLRWIEEDEVGGLIVSRGPVGEFAPMMNSLQARARVPLLIVSDLETGPSMRLTGGTVFPPAMAFGAADREALARRAGLVTALEARAAGIHVTLGPILDVNSNPLNPIINTRSFGEDPLNVGRLATAWIAGAREGGLLSAGKHFPGHGATEVDSHIGLPTLTASAGELDRLDVAPFRTAIAAGMDAVLVGHIAVPAIDGPGAPPASLSPGVVTGLLREQLGFDGLVITDALNMGAITRNYGVEEASILALLAGADALLQPPGERAVIAAIVRAVENGRIPRERIDESVRRMLRTKAAAGLHEVPRPSATGERAPAEHGRIAAEVASSSITLARDHRQLVPLPVATRRILHVAYSAGGNQAAGTFNGVLSGAGRTVEVVTVSDRTAASAYRNLAERARGFDLVVVSANLIPREYRGPLVLQGDFSRFAEGVIASGTPVVAVSFGSPYLLDYFPSVSTYLLAWSASAASQRAAARALLGELPIDGRLPVSLPPHHAVGDGVTRGVVGVRP